MFCADPHYTHSDRNHSHRVAQGTMVTRTLSSPHRSLSPDDCCEANLKATAAAVCANVRRSRYELSPNPSFEPG